LRAAWDQAGQGTRRKWFDEIIGSIFAESDAGARRRRRTAHGTPFEQTIAPDQSVVRFLKERTVSRSDGRVQGRVLYRAYVDWARENGELERTETWLGRELRRLGLKRIISHGSWRLGVA
jgi:hypothetical protein